MLTDVIVGLVGVLALGVLFLIRLVKLVRDQREISSRPRPSFRDHTGA